MSARYPLIRFVALLVGLPVAIAVVLPVWLARRLSVGIAWPAGPLDATLVALGVLAIGLGAVLIVSALAQIALRARAALAPWDPPPRLVIRGAYRRVRNPMISGVLFVLLGQALVLRSWPHALLAGAFLALALAYLLLLEEPQIEARFGDEYRRYCRHVSRLLPRLRPWRPEAE